MQIFVHREVLMRVVIEVHKMRNVAAAEKQEREKCSKHKTSASNHQVHQQFWGMKLKRTGHHL